VTEPEESEARRSPYQGLIPFDEGDWPFFFGRDTDIKLVCASLFASPLTLVYGPSGVGKTSVLHAGVLHRIRHRDDVLAVAVGEWHTGATARVKKAIRSEAKERAKALDVDPASSLEEHLCTVVKQLKRRPMVILDQFESYFLYPANRDFASEFPAAAATDLPISFLISIREDAVATLDQFEQDLPSVFDTCLRIEHLDRSGAEAAIVEPLAAWNELYSMNEPVTPGPGLVPAVLEQMRGQPVQPAPRTNGDSEIRIETPFLQLLLTELWEMTMYHGLRELTTETLGSLGGALEVMARHVRRAMSGLNVQEQDVAARIFQYLVTPSGSKIAYTARDVAFYAGLPPQQVMPVLEKLSGDARILRPVPPPLDRPAESRYEVFHDVLAQPILSWVPSVTQALPPEPVPAMTEELQADGVFAAGGVKFLSIVGALLGFAEHPTRPVTRWVQLAGTGGGAIVAALLACGRSPYDILELLKETDLRSFRDGGFLRSFGILNLLRRGGLARGDSFQAWLDRALDGRTFASVKSPETDTYNLRLIAADVTHGEMLVLPDDLTRYRLPFRRRIDPDSFRIADAVRMSMSIPFFFEPVKLVHMETGEIASILDGGLFAELPVWLFDTSVREAIRPTFGIQVMSHGGKSGLDRIVRTFKPMALGHDIFRTTSESADKRFMSHSTGLRTCIVDAGTVATTDFDLSREKVDALVDAGRGAARRYLDSFDAQTYQNVFGKPLRDIEETAALATAGPASRR
jgi:predicted acylesterase/phospholipase RssA